MNMNNLRYLPSVVKDGILGTDGPKFESGSNSTVREVIVDKDIYDNNQGVFIMDNDKILEKYLDSSNQDRRDMEKRLMEDRRESESRITEERRLSEGRMEKRFDETMKAVNALNTNIDNLNSSIDTKITTLTNNIDLKINSLEGKVNENNKFLRNLSISTILSIAALVIAVIAMAVTTILTIKQIKP